MLHGKFQICHPLMPLRTNGRQGQIGGLAPVQGPKGPFRPPGATWQERFQGSRRASRTRIAAKSAPGVLLSAPTSCPSPCRSKM
jgi:hypothetical protein